MLMSVQGVNGVPVDVPKMAVGNPNSPYHVYAIPAARRVGPAATLAPLLPDTKYQVRVVYELDDTSRFSFSTGNTRLMSPWSLTVTTNPVAYVSVFPTAVEARGLFQSTHAWFARAGQWTSSRLSASRTSRGVKR